MSVTKFSLGFDLLERFAWTRVVLIAQTLIIAWGFFLDDLGKKMDHPLTVTECELARDLMSEKMHFEEANLISFFLRN